MNAWLRSALVWFSCLVLSVAVAAGLVAGWGYVAYSSIYALPVLARGQVVMAEPETLSVGELQAGQRYKVAFHLTNLSSRPVVINGLRTSCTCVSADALPLEIPAHGRRPLHLWVHPGENLAGQPFSQTVSLYLSVPSARTSLTVLGTVAQANNIALLP